MKRGILLGALLLAACDDTEATRRRELAQFTVTCAKIVGATPREKRRLAALDCDMREQEIVRSWNRADDQQAAMVSAAVVAGAVAGASAPSGKR